MTHASPASRLGRLVLLGLALAAAFASRLFTSRSSASWSSADPGTREAVRHRPTDPAPAGPAPAGAAARHGGSGEADKLPGADDTESGARGTLVGFGLAGLLTLASFGLADTDLIWGPAVPVVLMVLAVAQMGVHLVFFLHLGSGPDHTNNIMALAFGVLIVVLVLTGSLWIMAHLNGNMMPMAMSP
jgi:cytochrome o ubiquinol oxidase operon protein cyoD